MTLTERLEAVASQIEAAFADGKFSFLEVMSTLAILEDVVKQTVAEYPTKPTEGQIQDMLTEAWKWADDKYSLVSKADDAIALPLLLEAFDGPAIRFVIERLAIPSLAKKLAA